MHLLGDSDRAKGCGLWPGSGLAVSRSRSPYVLYTCDFPHNS